MKTQKTYQSLKPYEAAFRCPICKSGMTFSNAASLVCENRHSFDLSRYGYINFLQKQPKPAYRKELFESRRRVFESGFYDKLIDTIEDMICIHTSSDSKELKILDAGCGEGFFTAKLASTDNAKRNMFAIDIEKEAVMMAARFADNAKYFVGDLANIPFKDGVMDIVLNIFSPANYGEFFRVLKDDGIVIKVVPNQGYLSELRKSAKGQLADDEYSNELILKLFGEKLDILDMKCVAYTLPLSEAQAIDFITMTPMMTNVDRTQIDPKQLTTITIDVTVMVGKLKL